MINRFDAIVIGGGMLGSAIGYGLVREGLTTAILDEGDVAYRAARGNFGLVWVQGKGVGCPAYANWTKLSSTLWSEFATELQERTHIELAHSQRGGIHLCLSETEFDERAKLLSTLSGHQKGGFTHEMLDRKAIGEYLPGLGPEVVGGSFSPHDGHVNPLYLLRAMQRAFVDLGGALKTDSRVLEISRDGEGFLVKTGDLKIYSGRIVLAAGLGNRELASMIGLEQPVRPVKGQVLVSERVGKFLDMPTTKLRQTPEGTVMIGDSKEELGFDIRSTPRVGKNIADRARRSFPFLSKTRVVRTWAALRVMTPDGLPIYNQSELMPGAFAASCHSGVTLAAVHALTYARYVANGVLGDQLSALSAERLNV